jgi:hypothetical protein
MAKAVLVMDMPESCFGCNLCHIDDGEDRATCQAYETAKEVNSDIFEKPEWCPLRELPKKKEEFELRKCKGSVKGTWKVPLIENKGFNACLDEILKGKKVGGSE